MESEILVLPSGPLYEIFKNLNDVDLLQYLEVLCSAQRVVPCEILTAVCKDRNLPLTDNIMTLIGFLHSPEAVRKYVLRHLDLEYAIRCTHDVRDKLRCDFMARGARLHGKEFLREVTKAASQVGFHPAIDAAIDGDVELVKAYPQLRKPMAVLAAFTSEVCFELLFDANMYKDKQDYTHVIILAILAYNDNVFNTCYHRIRYNKDKVIKALAKYGQKQCFQVFIENEANPDRIEPLLVKYGRKDLIGLKLLWDINVSLSDMEAIATDDTLAYLTSIRSLLATHA